MRALSIFPSILGRFGRDGRYVLLACAVFAFIFGGAMALGSRSGLLTPSSRSAVERPAGRPAELNTGRIVFTTPYGSTCRQMLIDNDTWHLTDNGTVDCSGAVPASSKPEVSPSGSDRFLELRSGFRK